MHSCSYDSLLLITRGKDTGIIAQKLKLLNIETTIYTTGWAMNQEFVDFSGNAITDVVFLGNANPQNNTPEYNEFANLFFQQFGHDPNQRHYYGYEAASLMLTGLENVTELTSDSVKEYLVQLGKFSGSENYQLNAYGDTAKEVWLIKYIDDTLEAFDSIKP